MGFKDFFKPKSKTEIQEASGVENRGVPGKNPYSGPEAAYQGPVTEVVEKVEHDPSAVFVGAEAISAVRSTGEFTISDPDKNTENPFFWRGVENALVEESKFNAKAGDALNIVNETRLLVQMKADGTTNEKIDVTPAVMMIERSLGQIAA